MPSSGEQQANPERLPRWGVHTLFCATSSAIAQAHLAVARGTAASGARMSTRTGKGGRKGGRKTAANAVPAAREVDASAAYSDGDDDVGSSGSSDE